MSVYICGMELDGRPHKALFTQRDGKDVLVVETQYSYDDNEIRVYPVQEIPPHGDLIDAQEQMKLMQSYNFDTYDDYNRAFDMLDNAPTVIPASEETA